MPPSAVQGCCSGSPEGGRTRTGCAGSSLQWQLRSQDREAAHARAALEVPCSGSSALRPGRPHTHGLCWKFPAAAAPLAGQRKPCAASLGALRGAAVYTGQGSAELGNPW